MKMSIRFIQEQAARVGQLQDYGEVEQRAKATSTRADVKEHIILFELYENFHRIVVGQLWLLYLHVWQIAGYTPQHPIELI